MMKRTIPILVSLAMIAVVCLSWMKGDSTIEITPNTYVSDVQFALGMAKPLHYLSPDKVNPASIKRGEEIVKAGRTIGPDGKKSGIQSKHFKCISCHNVEREDPVLSSPDPTARLDYVYEKGLPFLQGSVLHGIVNRESWYNEDYFVKYGDLVKSSRDTLINAIKLCTVECSQGRLLAEWEMESVLAYFWSIGLRLGDLDLSEKEMRQIRHAMGHNAHGADIIEMLKSKYYLRSPATFLEPLPTEERGFGKTGNPENGKKIFESGCLHCHTPGRWTKYTFEDSKQMHRKLKGDLGEWSRFSAYYITRKGTHPYVGYTPYMPHYTLERMNHQQLEDLVSYINQRAE